MQELFSEQGTLSGLLSGWGPRLGTNGPGMSVRPGLGNALVVVGLQNRVIIKLEMMLARFTNKNIFFF